MTDIQKYKTNWKELREYIEKNDWMVNDGFWFNIDSSFPQKIEFFWVPNPNNFKIPITTVIVYIDTYQNIDYDTYINFYVSIEWKKSYDTHKIQILPMYDEKTNTNDYDNIDVNFFYTMYNMIFHYASAK